MALLVVACLFATGLGITVAAAIHEYRWRRQTRRRAFDVDLVGRSPRES